ncbi:MAG: rhomboid family intramembrane serine protease [Sedimenticola sp.]
MILLPFDRAFDWRNPPVVTLVLVLLNSLCFFIWQGGEEVALDEAIGYYYSSGLAEQEYAGFVRFNGTDSESTDDDGIEAIGNAYHRYFEMRRDSQFYAALIANQVITPDTDGYTEWRSRRDQYEALLARVVFIKYGLKTAQPDWQSMIAHMFLHADFMHLFGNMFFLIAVGLLVEQTLGRWTYLLSYLVVGLGSGLFDVWISAGSFIPGIGASGAVSGVMGMYSVLY